MPGAGKRQPIRQAGRRWRGGAVKRTRLSADVLVREDTSAADDLLAEGGPAGLPEWHPQRLAACCSCQGTGCASERGLGLQVFLQLIQQPLVIVVVIIIKQLLLHREDELRATRLAAANSWQAGRHGTSKITLAQPHVVWPAPGGACTAGQAAAGPAFSMWSHPSPGPRQPLTASCADSCSVVATPPLPSACCPAAASPLPVPDAAAAASAALAARACCRRGTGEDAQASARHNNTERPVRPCTQTAGGQSSHVCRHAPRLGHAGHKHSGH